MSSNPVTTGAAAIGEVDVDAIAAAVRGCPAVDDLAGGRLASVATYLPGRQVAGLRVEPDRVTVQVRALWDVPVAEVAAQIRAALAPLAGTRTVDVELADVADPAQGASSAELVQPTSPAEPVQPTAGAELSPTTARPPQLPAGGSVETWTPSMPGAESSGESSSAPTIPTVAETRTNS